jgi:hypothetical protein
LVPTEHNVLGEYAHSPHFEDECDPSLCRERLDGVSSVFGAESETLAPGDQQRAA